MSSFVQTVRERRSRAESVAEAREVLPDIAEAEAVLLDLAGVFSPLPAGVRLLSRMSQRGAERSARQTETRQISRPNIVLSLSKYRQSSLWHTWTVVSAKRT